MNRDSSLLIENFLCVTKSKRNKRIKNKTYLDTKFCFTKRTDVLYRTAPLKIPLESTST
jgi:hypothetical protein